MRTQIVFVLLTLFSVAAHADLGAKKPLKADFHNLIVNSYQERSQLANGVSDKIQKPAPAKSHDQDSHRRVTDFVDVEIGWGEAPTVVDRRFDSVGEAVVVDAATEAKTH